MSDAEEQTGQAEESAASEQTSPEAVENEAAVAEKTAVAEKNGDVAQVEVAAPRESMSRGAPRSHLRDMQPVEGYEPIPVSIKSLLAAGAHFGHKAEKWNPKMLQYIFGVRSGVHVINLDQTLEAWQKARKFISDVVSRGGTVLFVGTKLQARPLVKEAADRCGAFYVNNRWLGGTMSNFQTIKNSISRMNKMEELLNKASEEGSEVRLGKKERLVISRNLEKLENNIGGIRAMRKLPDVLFVIDINKESIAVAEARRLHIPVVALVDTNADPDVVQFAIPSNDDATRTIKLMVNGIADAIIEGRSTYDAMINEMAQREEKVHAAAPRRGRSGKNSGAAVKSSAVTESASAGGTGV